MVRELFFGRLVGSIDGGPKTLLPSFFISPSRRDAPWLKLWSNFWVIKINNQGGLSLVHLVQFAKLWKMVQHVHLDPNATDLVTWILTNDVGYSSKSAYSMQFLGHTMSSMPYLVRKPWAPPKCKAFALLVIQNRVWMVVRLERRGWQNCATCKLCNLVQETASYILFKCRYKILVWSKVKQWLGLHDVDPSTWHAGWNVKDWWTEAIQKQGPSKKAMASLVMLISCEIWKERNVQVFRVT
jgi:hypothetical protein